MVVILILPYYVVIIFECQLTVTRADPKYYNPHPVPEAVVYNNCTSSYQ